MKKNSKVAAVAGGVVFSFVFAGAMSVFGAGAPTDKASVAAGKKLYGTNCAVCHGPKGKGDGAGSKGLNPPPRNFTTGKFKFGKDDASLFKTLAKGSPGTAMPAWTSLSEKQRWQVISYLKTLIKK